MTNILRNNNLFNHDFGGSDFPIFREYQYMRADIYELDNKYTIEIELPGFGKENIIINYENGYITIGAVKTIEKNDLDKYVRKERFTGDIKRSFYIGEKNVNDIKATYKDGLLNITFPKIIKLEKLNKNIAID